LGARQSWPEFSECDKRVTEALCDIPVTLLAFENKELMLNHLW
jgi:hypothetical protein